MPPAQPIDQPLLPNKLGEVINWGKLHGSAASYTVASLARQIADNQASSNGPIIYVCSETAHLHSIEKELSFYLGDSTLIHSFPDWECLPYDRVSPHPDLISQRLLALHKLPSLNQGVVIMPIAALMQRLTPSSYIDAHTFILRTGDDFNTEAFRKRLTDAGYYNVEQVMSPGEFAVRGGIVDVFPTGMEQPFRLDLFDTEIETIRLFDTETQRSTTQLEEIRLLPAREFPLDGESARLFHVVGAIVPARTDLPC